MCILARLSCCLFVCVRVRVCVCVFVCVDIVEWRVKAEKKDNLVSFECIFGCRHTDPLLQELGSTYDSRQNVHT